MPASKRPEIVLATWAGKTGAEFFGDRRFARLFGDSHCDSMWLTLRVVDDDSHAAYKLRQVMSNIGLWVWWSTDSDTIHVEFRAHEVHSATVTELQAMVSELQRLNKRIPARLHGENYASYVRSTIHAAGIKRRVEYHGFGNPEQHHSIQSAFGPLVNEIESRSKVAA